MLTYSPALTAFGFTIATATNHLFDGSPSYLPRHKPYLPSKTTLSWTPVIKGWLGITSLFYRLTGSCKIMPILTGPGIFANMILHSPVTQSPWSQISYCHGEMQAYGCRWILMLRVAFQNISVTTTQEMTQV